MIEYKRLGRPHTYGKNESHLFVSLDTGVTTNIVLTEAELCAVVGGEPVPYESDGPWIPVVRHGGDSE